MATTIEKPDLKSRAAAKSGQRSFRAKDLLNQVVIQGLAVAPDGESVVYVRRTVEDNKYARRLWRVPFEGGRPEQLTSAKSNDTRPRFSPDGRTLLFISDRSSKPQVWLMPLQGGEPRQLTDLPNGAGAAEWSPGGYRDEFTSVWIVDVEGGKPARLTAPTYDVGGACWSRDGKHIAFIADLREEAALSDFSQLWSLPSRPGKDQPTQMAEVAGAVFNAAWAPAPQVAFLGTSEPMSPGWSNVNLYLADGKTTNQLAAGRDLDIWNTTYGDFADGEQFFPPPMCWIDQQHVAALVANRGSSHPYSFGTDGTVTALAKEDVVCNAIAAGGGRVAVVASGDGPADVHEVEDGKLRRLSDDGSKWFGPFRRPIERVEVPHPDGHNIDAWLLRAHGAAGKAPLVVAVHGGPNLSYGPTPWLEMSALAGAGFHVVWSNPRGSTGYGEAYARAIAGRWSEKDASDIMRVADWAVEQGLADRDRRGVFGLSYGGFMTNWLLSRHPGAFKAAVS